MNANLTNECMSLAKGLSAKIKYKQRVTLLFDIHVKFTQ